MMAEYLQEGATLDYVNPSDEDAIEPGTVIKLGSIVGIAATYIEPNEVGSVAIEGVWTFDTDDTDTEQGAPVYLNEGEDKATKTAGDTVLGICAYTPKDNKIAVKINAGAAAGT